MLAKEFVERTTFMDGRKHLGNERPKLLLVYANSVHAAQCSRYLRRQGWDVHLSPSCDEARRQAEALAPAAVVLDADAPAWQSCAQQIHGQMGTTIVIVAANADVAKDWSHTKGTTAFVNRDGGPQALAAQLGAAYA